MSRKSLAFPALALVVAACGSGPTALTCPTKAQSLTFTAAGSCGGAATGTVTISTQPGLCALTVKGGDAVNIPTQGQFSGAASTTGYDLTKGNWYLFVSQGNTEEGSVEITCDESSSQGSNVVNLSCSGMNCPADDCGGSVSCSNIDCNEHLTPVK